MRTDKCLKCEWKKKRNKTKHHQQPPKKLNPISGSVLVLSFAYTPTQGDCNGMVEFHMNVQLQVVFSKNWVTSKSTSEEEEILVAPPSLGKAGIRKMSCLQTQQGAE